jgi:choloylglycine hydrolase
VKKLTSGGEIMCTSITYSTRDHYFGRNFDYELSYEEVVTITPRNYPLNFRKVDALPKHYAMIGIAAGIADYPLYYDATNEKGLSMAGLNFPGLADYKEPMENKDNITPFEFIPWILGQCSTVAEAKELLNKINLVNINFSEKLPLSPLHWLLADKESSIVVESKKDGLHVYDNPLGVLTNNPSFDYHLFNLNNYRSLSRKTPANTFSDALELHEYSRGMGGIGLPGDLSSMSRFVRAAFTKLNSVSGDSESESISQFFHILGSVEQQKGLCDVGDGKYEYTIYSSCCNVDKGIYYYRTYENSQIVAVDMHKEDLDSEKLISYPLVEQQQVHYIN